MYIMKKVIRLREFDLSTIIKRVIKEQRTNTGCIEGDCENGLGTYKWSNGDVYKGQWKDGNLNGVGTFKWPNGDVYTGQYKDDSRNGQGTYKWKNGDVYKGQYKDGVRTGVGTFKWENGAVYTGQIKDGIRNGQGTYTNPNGVKKYGVWVDGKLNGKSIEDLDKIKQSNTGCAQPTKPTHSYKDDKNYQYAKSGDCWWAKNINNNRWFNLTELVKTNSKIKISIDKLNDGTNLIKL